MSESSPPPWPHPRWLDQPGGPVLDELARVIEEARRSDDRPALVRALILKGDVAGGLGRPEADTALQQARAEAVRVGEPDLLCQALLAQARLDSDRGQHARALGACRSATELARAQRLSALLRQALFTGGVSLCHVGEHDLALESFEEARMLLRANPTSLSAADHQVAQGRYAAAQAQAWLMRGGLLLEASGPEAAADPLQRARTLGEQACEALLGASPRFSHAALFGLVRVLLEAGEAHQARGWVARVDAHCPVSPPAGSLALAQRLLGEAMIELRAGQADARGLLGRLAMVEAVRHPRVVGGDLRLSLLRCQFEAHEAAGQFREALACQREWSKTKARLRASLSKEHGQWTAETLAGLRAEADDFVSLALRAPLMEARESLAELLGAVDGDTGSDTGGPANEPAPGLKRADHSVSRAIDIADQYLGVVRAEYLRREDLAAIDLSELVDDVCDQMAPPPGDPVRLERSVDRAIVVRGDRVLLMRALANLISNAFKHAPAHSAVHVGLQHQGGGVRLSVKDEGPGMPLEMRARIFQRFATGAVRKGNGLGLAMVARAARVHEAQIVVESEPNQGTCVVIALGLEKAALQ